MCPGSPKNRCCLLTFSSSQEKEPLAESRSVLCVACDHLPQPVCRVWGLVALRGVLLAAREGQGGPQDSFCLETHNLDLG